MTTTKDTKEVHMNRTFFRNVVLIASILLTVSSCGGGGGGDVASGGTGGTGISAGSITGFGSVFVNGVEFFTSGAVIRRNDSSIAETELRKGMVVEVEGSIASSTSGTATTVTVEEAVRGPVESKTGTASAGTFVVLGQTVRVDDTTLFDNNVPNFGSVTVGDLLEVHGHRKNDGSIAASFIERKAAPVEFVVRGTVANHNNNASPPTFMIGALTVDYSGGVTINNMPAASGSNWNNLFVEVKGVTCTGIPPGPACGTLKAQKVEPEGLALADANQAEIEGFVTAQISMSDFTVNFQRVLVGSATIFVGGLPSEIVPGVELEVEGSLAGGVLSATKVRFKDGVKLESNASVSGSTISLDGLPNITVTVNAFTRFEGTTATDVTLAPLHNRNVRIRGRASGATSVIATEIEDKAPTNPNADVIVQGFVNKADVANPIFKILGVTVDTSLLNDPTDFLGVNDQPIGRAGFFNALTPNGGLAKARGKLPATNAVAAGSLKEIELED